MTRKKTLDRCRIFHEFDLYKGKIGHIVERIDQHSLVTYVVNFPNHPGVRRAYQRNEIKLLKTLYKTKPI